MIKDADLKPAGSTRTLRAVYLYFKYCNLKCRHCWINPPFSDKRGVKDDEAPMEDIISALDECRQLGMSSVKLTGGEPFIRSDIFQLLDYLKNNKISVAVETNGTLIGEEEARALKHAGAGHISVSIDGPDADTHEALRGVKGSFNDALRGIESLTREGLKPQMIICLWRGNRDRMVSTLDLAKSLGIKSVKVNPVLGIERADAMSDKDETMNVKEVIESYHHLRQECKRIGGIDLMFDIPPAFYPIVNMQLERLCVCGIFGILGILGNGDVSICGIGQNAEALLLGKIGRDKMSDIWQNHPVFSQIREGVPDKMEGVCGRCMLKLYCLGKCRADAYYTSGSLLAPLPFCQTAYDQGLFPESRLMS
ncbi:MAG: radical SAM protein [Candidatus Omnitrophica bacterium]|nr:radical SAM protein [Candidatus Omnitrophota bacterium]